MHAECGIRHHCVAGVETCALPISPRPSPDGTQLVWLTWNQPNMPWDGTELWLAELDAAGAVRSEERRVGKEGRSGGWRQPGMKSSRDAAGSRYLTMQD